jgi:hypothetical protein
MDRVHRRHGADAVLDDNQRMGAVDTSWLETGTCVCTCERDRVSERVNESVRVSNTIYIYICMYIYICIYTHTHTYIHH